MVSTATLKSRVAIPLSSPRRRFQETKRQLDERLTTCSNLEQM